MYDNATLETFETEFGSAGRALSRLIRPAFAAPKGRTLVWGDWAAIEARVLPWLADSRGSHQVLDVFRKSDADPNEPDIYVREAANIDNCDPRDLWAKVKAKDKMAKNQRQTGKVAVLSLGFGGAVGALQAMATGYGISLTEAEARAIVDAWRHNNGWARMYWDSLWDAFLAAMENPDTPYTVGKTVYMYDKDYLRGTMFCFLPDGRPLTYPSLRWKKREREDREGNIESRMELTYRRGHDTRSLWYGVLAENNTQAVAGSLLRDCLARLSPAPNLTDAPRGTWVQPDLALTSSIIGHTHDEIIAECDDTEEDVALTRDQLQTAMEYVPPWAEGLPLVAEVSDNWYYTKVID